MYLVDGTKIIITILGAFNILFLRKKKICGLKNRSLLNTETNKVACELRTPLCSSLYKQRGATHVDQWPAAFN